MAVKYIQFTKDQASVLHGPYAKAGDSYRVICEGANCLAIHVPIDKVRLITLDKADEGIEYVVKKVKQKRGQRRGRGSSKVKGTKGSRSRLQN